MAVTVMPRLQKHNYKHVHKEGGHSLSWSSVVCSNENKEGGHCDIAKWAYSFFHLYEEKINEVVLGESLHLMLTFLFTFK